MHGRRIPAIILAFAPACDVLKNVKGLYLMIAMPWLRPGAAIRRFLGAEMPPVERRVANLPVMVERRRSMRCSDCGIGTMHPIAAGAAYAGSLQCDHSACQHIENSTIRNAMECVIRAS